MPRRNVELIAAALRKQICLEPPTDSPVLHEQSLAETFRVSRTPVRQALQRLAYERLVEVRSGVGTVVSPLSEANRDGDIALVTSLLRAAAEVEGDRPLSMNAITVITALQNRLHASEFLDIDTNYEIRSTALSMITEEMTNDILADALKAALLRVFRWRMYEAQQQPTGIDPRLTEVLAGMFKATQIGTVRALMEAQTMEPPLP